MKSCKGIENPAFVSSSPDTPRRVCASSPSIDISVLPTPAAGSPPPPAPQEPLEPPQLSGVPGASELESLSEYEEGPCGWGSFQPRALQRCNTPGGFLFHYCLLALTQGIVVNGLVNISISTIEKRYELQSSLTGLISSSYDIAFCLLSLFVSFIGERGHKPRWLAFASFMLGLGALVFSLPKFFSGKYQFGSLYEAGCFTWAVWRKACHGAALAPACAFTVSCSRLPYLFMSSSTFGLGWVLTSSGIDKETRAKTVYPHDMPKCLSLKA